MNWDIVFGILLLGIILVATVVAFICSDEYKGKK